MTTNHIRLAFQPRSQRRPCVWRGAQPVVCDVDLECEPVEDDRVDCMSCGDGKQDPG